MKLFFVTRLLLLLLLLTIAVALLSALSGVNALETDPAWALSAVPFQNYNALQSNVYGSAPPIFFCQNLGVAVESSNENACACALKQHACSEQVDLRGQPCRWLPASSDTALTLRPSKIDTFPGGFASVSQKKTVFRIARCIPRDKFEALQRESNSSSRCFTFDADTADGDSRTFFLTLQPLAFTFATFVKDLITLIIVGGVFGNLLSLLSAWAQRLAADIWSLSFFTKKSSAEGQGIPTCYMHDNPAFTVKIKRPAKGSGGAGTHQQQQQPSKSNLTVMTDETGPGSESTFASRQQQQRDDDGVGDGMNDADENATLSADDNNYVQTFDEYVGFVSTLLFYPRETPLLQSRLEEAVAYVLWRDGCFLSSLETRPLTGRLRLPIFVEGSELIDLARKSLAANGARKARFSLSRSVLMRIHGALSAAFTSAQLFFYLAAAAVAVGTVVAEVLGSMSSSERNSRSAAFCGEDACSVREWLARIFTLSGIRVVNSGLVCTQALVLVKSFRHLASGEESNNQVTPLAVRLPRIDLEHSILAKTLLGLYLCVSLPFVLGALFIPGGSWPGPLVLLVLLPIALLICRALASWYKRRVLIRKKWSEFQQDVAREEEENAAGASASKPLLDSTPSAVTNIAAAAAAADEEDEEKKQEIIHSPAVDVASDTYAAGGDGEKEASDFSDADDTVIVEGRAASASEINARRLDAIKLATDRPKPEREGCCCCDAKFFFRSVISFILFIELPVILLALSVQLSFTYAALFSRREVFGIEDALDVFAFDYRARSLDCQFWLLQQDVLSLSGKISQWATVLPFF